MRFQRRSFLEDVRLPPLPPVLPPTGDASQYTVVSSRGSAERTLANRANDDPNVEDWRGHNGDSSDWNAIQSGINALAVDGGDLHVDRFYEIDAPIVLDYTSVSQDPVNGGKRVSLIGAGIGVSRIRSTHAGVLLDIRGGSGEGAHAFLPVKGIGFRGPGPAAVGSIGIKADNMAYSHLEEVDIYAFEYGFYGTDVLSSSIQRSAVRSCKVNVFLAGIVNFSPPNAFALRDCIISAATVGGVYMKDGSCLLLDGGSVEGNGTSDTDQLTGYGVKVEDCGNGGQIGLRMQGAVYIEGNKGIADVWLVQTTANDVLHSIEGISFQRFLLNQYVTQNILFTRSGNNSKIKAVGNKFGARNSYVESAARPYVTAPPGSLLGDFLADNVFENVLARDASRPSILTRITVPQVATVFVFTDTQQPSSSATQVMVANTLYAWPIGLLTARRFGAYDALAYHITTGAVGNGRLGIYEADTVTGLPGNLVAETAAQIDTNITGAQVSTFASNRYGDRPLWVAAVFNSTPTFRAGAAIGPGMGHTAISVANGFTHLTRAFTYAPLPATFPSAPGMAGVGSAMIAPRLV